MKLGNLIFYKNIPEFGSWLQRWVSNTIYSHVSIIAGYNRNIGKLMEFDASYFVRFRSFEHRRPEHMDILAVNATREIKVQALINVIDAYEGMSYGYIQWLTTALRFLFEWMGFKGVKSWNILWGWGVFCSELVYYYLMEIAIQMEVSDEPPNKRMQWHLIKRHLLTFNPDIFVPQDIIDMVDIFSVLRLNAD